MSHWFASVDTAFLLNLEQGSKEEIEVFERLKLSGYKIRFVPVVSHELMAHVKEKKKAAPVAAGFLAKRHIYNIDRQELDGNQLDYAKAAADEIMKQELLPTYASNVAHLIAESACRECFLISGLSSIKAAKWPLIQKCLTGAHLSAIKRYTIMGYLRKPAMGYSKP